MLSLSQVVAAIWVWLRLSWHHTKESTVVLAGQRVASLATRLGTTNAIGRSNLAIDCKVYCTYAGAGWCPLSAFSFFTFYFSLLFCIFFSIFLFIYFFKTKVIAALLFYNTPVKWTNKQLLLIWKIYSHFNKPLNNHSVSFHLVF